jgi:hypothetical protein
VLVEQESLEMAVPVVSREARYRLRSLQSMRLTWTAGWCEVKRGQSWSPPSLLQQSHTAWTCGRAAGCAV